MATETVHTRIREGAAAFIEMMKTVQVLSEADLARYSEVAETGRDVRDYRQMADAVGCALRRNLFEADVGHAQGFLRALTDLLSLNVDGCGIGPNDDWDPIRSTAAAYGEKQEVTHG